MTVYYSVKWSRYGNRYCSFITEKLIEKSESFYYTRNHYIMSN